MRTLRVSLLWTAVIVVQLAEAAKAETQLQFVQSWCNLLSGQVVTIPLLLRRVQELPITLQWRLLVENRALARGERKLDADQSKGDRDRIETTLRVQVPSIRDDLSMKCHLIVECFGSNGNLIASTENLFWIYGLDPFSGVRTAMIKTPIYLFDPHGTSAEVFRKSDLPYREIAKLERVNHIEHGLLVIGEGLSLEEYPQVDKAMVGAIGRGMSVLCLAPQNGVISLAGLPDSPYPRPERVEYANAEIVRRFDKRLDSTHWTGGIDSAQSGVLQIRRGSRILGQISNDRLAWPWIEADFSGPSRKLTICGLNLIAHWNETPVPRELLARVIEHVHTSNNQTPSTVEKEDPVAPNNSSNP